MLNARLLDFAIVFETGTARHWNITPLLDERLFLMGSPYLAGMPTGTKVHLRQIGSLPLVMPSGVHGLRSVVSAAFARAKVQPNLLAEIDGLAVLMDAVRAGIAATIQPGAATSRLAAETVRLVQVADAGAQRRNLLVSLRDSELSPAALAARVVLVEVVRTLVAASRWAGASLHEA
jgi:LysR family tcuABC transcriptional regulator